MQACLDCTNNVSNCGAASTYPAYFCNYPNLACNTGRVIYVNMSASLALLNTYLTLPVDLSSMVHIVSLGMYQRLNFCGVLGSWM